MQIEQVIGGVNGDTSAQAIQLRMRSSFQGNLAPARIRVFDANGQNPVTIIDFTESVFNNSLGDRVLITTAAFDALTNPTCVPDFTMTNPIPASYLAAGSLVFEQDAPVIIWWRLSWGGSDYTGPHNGSTTNDTDGDFGPAWPGPLPSSGVQALFFDGIASDMSTNNADDYELTPGAATFTNNAHDSFVIDDGGGPIDAPLTDVAMGLRGTSISGGLAQLLTSDNTFHNTRSQFGFLATEPNVLNVIYGFDSPNLAATQIGMTVEHRLNQPGGSVRWQFKHWNTNSFGAAVHTYPIGSTEITQNQQGISTTNRIRQTDGRMEMQVTVFTLSVFSPLGFDQFTDFVQATVQ